MFFVDSECQTGSTVVLSRLLGSADTVSVPWAEISSLDRDNSVQVLITTLKVEVNCV